MDRETVRFGILGCGTVAGYHAAAIRATAGAELVCACGNTAGPAERFCREQGIDRMQSYAGHS